MAAGEKRVWSVSLRSVPVEVTVEARDAGEAREAGAELLREIMVDAAELSNVVVEELDAGGEPSPGSSSSSAVEPEPDIEF